MSVFHLWRMGPESSMTRTALCSPQHARFPSQDRLVVRGQRDVSAKPCGLASRTFLYVTTVRAADDRWEDLSGDASAGSASTKSHSMKPDRSPVCLPPRHPRVFKAMTLLAPVLRSRLGKRSPCHAAAFLFCGRDGHEDPLIFNLVDGVPMLSSRTQRSAQLHGTIRYGSRSDVYVTPHWSKTAA